MLPPKTIETIQGQVDQFKNYLTEDKTKLFRESRGILAKRVALLLESDSIIDDLSESDLDELKTKASLLAKWTAPGQAKKDFASYNPFLTITTFKEMLKKLIDEKNGDTYLADRFSHFRNVIKTFGPVETSALLSARYPEKYALWGSSALKALKILRINNVTSKSTPEINGIEYKRYNRLSYDVQLKLAENGIALSRMDIYLFFTFLEGVCKGRTVGTTS